MQNHFEITEKYKPVVVEIFNALKKLDRQSEVSFIAQSSTAKKTSEQVALESSQKQATYVRSLLKLLSELNSSERFFRMQRNTKAYKGGNDASQHTDTVQLEEQFEKVVQLKQRVVFILSDQVSSLLNSLFPRKKEYLEMVFVSSSQWTETSDSAQVELLKDICQALMRSGAAELYLDSYKTFRQSFLQIVLYSVELFCTQTSKNIGNRNVFLIRFVVRMLQYERVMIFTLLPKDSEARIVFLELCSMTMDHLKVVLDRSLHQFRHLVTIDAMIKHAEVLHTLSSNQAALDGLFRTNDVVVFDSLHSVGEEAKEKEDAAEKDIAVIFDSVHNAVDLFYPRKVQQYIHDHFFLRAYHIFKAIRKRAKGVRIKVNKQAKVHPRIMDYMNILNQLLSKVQIIRRLFNSKKELNESLAGILGPLVIKLESLLIGKDTNTMNNSLTFLFVVNNYAYILARLKQQTRFSLLLSEESLQDKIETNKLKYVESVTFELRAHIIRYNSSNRTDKDATDFITAANRWTKVVQKRQKKYYVLSEAVRAEIKELLKAAIVDEYAKVARSLEAKDTLRKKLLYDGDSLEVVFSHFFEVSETNLFNFS